MGETRVDLQHLLEDRRDAYSGPIEQTILSEVIANALDSGARRIRIQTNAAAATITVIDDAHPAYLRATASRSVGYHLALSVALALAPLAVEPAAEHEFITQFLAHRGGTPSKATRPSRKRRR